MALTFLPPPPVLSEALQVCHPHAAGIDIGEAEHWVAVPPGCDPQPVRRFGTFTVDLDALADWLIDCGVTTVAMESTGVYPYSDTYMNMLWNTMSCRYFKHSCPWSLAPVKPPFCRGKFWQCTQVSL